MTVKSFIENLYEDDDIKYFFECVSKNDFRKYLVYIIFQPATNKIEAIHSNCIRVYSKSC